MTLCCDRRLFHVLSPLWLELCRDWLLDFAAHNIPIAARPAVIQGLERSAKIANGYRLEEEMMSQALIEIK